MVAFTSIALAASTLLGLTIAAPRYAPTQEIVPTNITHRITVGSTAENGGLHMEPQIVDANIGDYITWAFLPKNHTIVQSSFEKPCEPIGGDKGVFAGFNFATQQGEAPRVFTMLVKDKNPFWYYCSQTVGNHCQKGMSGVINANRDSKMTLDKYKENSKGTVTKQPSRNITAYYGGIVKPNYKW